MSENTQERQYFDSEGKPISLYRLVRAEPDWAASRIKEGEKDFVRSRELLSALKEFCQWVAENYHVDDSGSAILDRAHCAISKCEEK